MPTYKNHENQRSFVNQEVWSQGEILGISSRVNERQKVAEKQDTNQQKPNLLADFDNIKQTVQRINEFQ